MLLSGTQAEAGVSASVASRLHPQVVMFLQGRWWTAGVLDEQHAGEPQRLDHVREVAAAGPGAGAHALVVPERRAGRVREAEVTSGRFGYGVGERVHSPVCHPFPIGFSCPIFRNVVPSSLAWTSRLCAMR